MKGLAASGTAGQHARKGADVRAAAAGRGRPGRSGSVDSIQSLEEKAEVLLSQGHDVEGINHLHRALLGRATNPSMSPIVWQAAERFVVRCNQLALKSLQAGQYQEVSLFLQRAEDALGVQTAPLGAPKPPTHEFFAGFSPLRTSLLVATLNNKAALLRLSTDADASLLSTQQAFAVDQEVPTTLLNMAALHFEFSWYEEALQYALMALQQLQRKQLPQRVQLNVPPALAHVAAHMEQERVRLSVLTHLTLGYIYSQMPSDDNRSLAQTEFHSAMFLAESGLGATHSLTKKAAQAHQSAIEPAEQTASKPIIALQIEAFRHFLPSDVQAVLGIMPPDKAVQGGMPYDTNAAGDTSSRLPPIPAAGSAVTGHTSVRSSPRSAGTMPPSLRSTRNQEKALRLDGPPIDLQERLERQKQEQLEAIRREEWEHKNKRQELARRKKDLDERFRSIQQPSLPPSWSPQPSPGRHSSFTGVSPQPPSRTFMPSPRTALWPNEQQVPPEGRGQPQLQPQPPRQYVPQPPGSLPPKPEHSRPQPGARPPADSAEMPEGPPGSISSRDLEMYALLQKESGDLIATLTTKGLHRPLPPAQPFSPLSQSLPPASPTPKGVGSVASSKDSQAFSASASASQPGFSPPRQQHHTPTPASSPPQKPPSVASSSVSKGFTSTAPAHMGVRQGFTSPTSAPPSAEKTDDDRAEETEAERQQKRDEENAQATLVQSFVHAKLSSDKAMLMMAEVVKSLKAAIVVQTCWRGYSAKLVLKNRRVELVKKQNSSAFIIQSLFRRTVADKAKKEREMKEQAQLLKYHTAATLKIQAAWRMYRVQCQIDEMHEYAFKIQRFYHIFRAYKIVASFIRRRRYVKARAFDELKAAVRIQRYTRTVLKVILAKRELARRKQEARWKALACDVAQEQCHLVVQFRQETWAVGEMVKALRGHLWWMSVLKAEREDWARKHSALAIQCAWKQYKARQVRQHKRWQWNTRQHVLKRVEQLHEAALCIQKAFMYAQARSRLSVLKEERRVAEKAAATIQAAWEGHKGRCLARARVKERAEADALYLEQESQELAARVIQRAITAWLSERRFTWRLKMSAIRNGALQKIQAHVRRWKTTQYMKDLRYQQMIEKDNRRRRELKAACATRIATQWRCYKARQEVTRHRIKMHKHHTRYASQIQRWYRAKVQEKAFGRLLKAKREKHQLYNEAESLWWKVIVMQSAARMWAAQAEVRAMRQGLPVKSQNPFSGGDAARAVCAAAASERVATPTADPVPSPKTDTAPTPKSAASAARPVGTPGHFGTQIESSSVDSPSQAAYARMQYLVVLLKEKAPVFDGGVFARQVAMTQGAPENSVIVLDQIGNRVHFWLLPAVSTTQLLEDVACGHSDLAPLGIKCMAKADSVTGALDNPVYYSTRKPSPQPGSQRKSSPQPVPPPAASSKAADGGFGSAEEAERHQAACRIQRAQRCNAARGSRRAKEAQRDREMWDQVQSDGAEEALHETGPYLMFQSRQFHNSDVHRLYLRCFFRESVVRVMEQQRKAAVTLQRWVRMAQARAVVEARREQQQNPVQPPIAQLQAAAELAGGIIAYIVWRIGNHAALTIQTAFRQFLARQCLAAKVREKGELVAQLNMEEERVFAQMRVAKVWRGYVCRKGWREYLELKEVAATPKAQRQPQPQLQPEPPREERAEPLQRTREEPRHDERSEAPRGERKARRQPRDGQLEKLMRKQAANRIRRAWLCYQARQERKQRAGARRRMLRHRWWEVTEEAVIKIQSAYRRHLAILHVEGLWAARHRKLEEADATAEALAMVEWKERDALAQQRAADVRRIHAAEIAREAAATFAIRSAQLGIEEDEGRLAVRLEAQEMLEQIALEEERDCQRAVDAELDRRRHEIYMRQFIKDAEEESDRRLAELKEELGIQADLAQEDEEDQDPSQAVLQAFRMYEQHSRGNTPVGRPAEPTSPGPVTFVHSPSKGNVTSITPGLGFSIPFTTRISEIPLATSPPSQPSPKPGPSSSRQPDN